MKKITNEIIKAIKNKNNFIILAHSNPDGDATGSSLALALALTKLKKKVKIFLPYSTPERYKFLPGLNKFSISKMPHRKPEAIIILDTAGWKQIEKINPKDFDHIPVINIDHHIDNKKFGSINWIDTKASAVGEQIYQLLKELKITITKDIATCLYTALVTDSGGFRYSNTTTQTHKIASNLLVSGIKPQDICTHLYENIPLCKLKLLQTGLKTIKTSQQGQIIWMWITRKMFKQTKAKQEHTEEFIDFLKCTAGVKVAVVFREGKRHNEQRVTFRSRDPLIAVNKIAHKFNGGGHPAASGCTVFGSRQQTEQAVLKEVRKAIRKKRS